MEFQQAFAAQMSDMANWMIGIVLAIAVLGVLGTWLSRSREY